MKKKLTKRQFKKQQEDAVDHKHYRDRKKVQMDQKQAAIVNPKAIKKPLSPSTIQQGQQVVNKKGKQQYSSSTTTPVVMRQKFPSSSSPAASIKTEQDEEEEEDMDSDEEFARCLEIYCNTSDNKESASPFTTSKRRRFPQKRGSKKNKRYKKPTVFHAGNRCFKTFKDDNNNGDDNTSSATDDHNGTEDGSNVITVNGN